MIDWQALANYIFVGSVVVSLLVGWLSAVWEGREEDRKREALNRRPGPDDVLYSPLDHVKPKRKIRQPSSPSAAVLSPGPIREQSQLERRIASLQVKADQLQIYVDAGAALELKFHEELEKAVTARLPSEEDIARDKRREHRFAILVAVATFIATSLVSFLLAIPVIVHG